MLILSDFISALNDKLPDICTERDLIQTIPLVFKSHATLTRMRERNLAPPHFYIEPNYYYLKGEVISWIKSKHIDSGRDCFTEAVAHADQA